MTVEKIEEGAITGHGPVKEPVFFEEGSLKDSSITGPEPEPVKENPELGSVEFSPEAHYPVQLDPEPVAGFDRYWAEISSANRDYAMELDNVVRTLGPAPGHSAVDAGCGEGWLSRSLGNIGLSVTAIDISADLIGMAREREIKDQAVIYVHGDAAQKMKDLDEFSQDFVISWAASWGYRHIDQLGVSEALFHEAYRVLNGGGKFLLQVINPIMALVGGVSRSVNRCEDGTTVVEYLVRDPLHPKLSLDRWVLGLDKAAFDQSVCHAFTFEQLEEKLLRTGFATVQPVGLDELFLTLVAVK